MTKEGPKAPSKRRPAQKRAGKGRSRRKPKFDKLEVVETLLKEVAEELKAKKGKPTVTDFIRLLELRKELRGEEPAPIEVTWVDPKRWSGDSEA